MEMEYMLEEDCNMKKFIYKYSRKEIYVGVDWMYIIASKI